jgi:hypothetical protein
MAICYEKMGNFKDAIEMDKKALTLGWNANEQQTPRSTRSIDSMTRLRNIQAENASSTSSKKYKEVEKEEVSKRSGGNLGFDDDNDDILSINSISTTSLTSLLSNSKADLKRAFSSERLKEARLESGKQESAKNKTSNNAWSYIALLNKLESKEVKSRICDAFLKTDATENKNMFENLLLLSKGSRKLFEDFVLRETNYEVKTEDILKFSKALNDLFLTN